MILFVPSARRDQECMDQQEFISPVSLCDHVSFRTTCISKRLIQLLNPVLDFYSEFYVGDSFSFASIIRQLSPCVDPQILVSFNIASLFTNVTPDEVISICADFLYRSFV